MRTSLRLISVTVAAGATLLLAPGAAQAHDHLANATSSNGVDARGFANPVAANPSGTSGPASQPATVPGLGDPKAGLSTGTPSFDLDSLCARTEARSAGTPARC